MKRVMFAVLLIFVAGCVSQSEPEVRYVCPTGEVVSDVSLCPQEVTTTTTTLSTIATTTTTQAVEQVPTATGFGKIIPLEWSLFDDGTLKILVENGGSLDIRVIKITVNQDERNIIAQDISKGSSKEVTSSGVSVGSVDQKYSIGVSIVVLELKLKEDLIKTNLRICAFHYRRLVLQC